MPRAETVSDETVFAVIDRFIRKKESANQIVSWLAAERGIRLSREQIYPIMKKALERGFITLTAPESAELAQRLIDRFDFGGEYVGVVDVRKRDAVDELAALAAKRVLALICELGGKKKRVRIGFAPGRTSMSVARQLALAMRVAKKDTLPKLTLHALSSGLSVDHPETSPTSYFSYFSEFDFVDYRCLFAMPFVRHKEELASLKDFAGVARCFKEAQQVDIVVTSLGSAGDAHSDLRFYFDTNDAAGLSPKAKLDALGWTGEIMCRPFGPDGEPIEDDSIVRAVTCLEIADLTRIANSAGRHVVLVSPPCSKCATPKTDALFALMNRKQRAFSSLVLDVGTAGALIEKKKQADSAQGD